MEWKECGAANTLTWPAATATVATTMEPPAGSAGADALHGPASGHASAMGGCAAPTAGPAGAEC